MNTLRTFNHEMFGNIRTMNSERGETFFVGKDIAEALGYAKSRNALAAHVDAEDKEDALIQGPLGGAQTMAQWGQAPLRRGSIFHTNLYITLLGTFPDNLTT